ncbi:OsmC/Ohr family [Rhypophila decipiens]|uniref:OsmC/Ohr family n=1 Tax=Rhypophila decipiens TaxID=261697 RepID=A0AAN6Y3F2_9PEZI|nr:OsmC/Ohr family [Rhypophila decipiens]
MIPARLTKALTRRSALSVKPQLLPQSTIVNYQRRQFSQTRPALTSTLPVQIHGKGSGTSQTITVQNKPYTFQTDTYTTLGGNDAHPSPVAYSLASLGSCNQVTGSVVARDHGIKVGQWDVEVEGQLPTDVLVGGKQGNPNWVSVELKIHVQTDLDVATEEGRKKWDFFVGEVERRCPITQLFKLSGVRYESVWVNERL